MLPQVIKPTRIAKNDLTFLRQSIKVTFLDAVRNVATPLELESVFLSLLQMASGASSHTKPGAKMSLEERRFQLDAIKILHKLVAGSQPLVYLGGDGTGQSDEVSAAIFELLEREQAEDESEDDDE